MTQRIAPLEDIQIETCGFRFGDSSSNNICINCPYHFYSLACRIKRLGWNIDEIVESHVTIDQVIEARNRADKWRDKAAETLTEYDTLRKRIKLLKKELSITKRNMCIAFENKKSRNSHDNIYTYNMTHTMFDHCKEQIKLTKEFCTSKRDQYKSEWKQYLVVNDKFIELQSKFGKDIREFVS